MAKFIQKLFGLGAKNIVLGVLRKFVFQTEKFGLPNISGSFIGHSYSDNDTDGAFISNISGASANHNYGNSVYKITLNSSLSNNKFGLSKTVQPLSFRVLNICRI